MNDSRGKRKKIVVCICGLAGCGKSTVAKRLARKYGLEYYSGGAALKALAIEAGYKPMERGWWESEEGLGFLRERSQDLSFDRRVDEKLLAVARLGGVVLDSWTMPWLLKDGFKVWLECSEKVRAERLAKRNGITSEVALKVLRDKEERTRRIYEGLYGFVLGEDFGPFDLILDVSLLSADEVLKAISLVVDNLLLKKR
jgi:cytidylate kinase